jgi:hypothetical protein
MVLLFAKEIRKSTKDDQYLHPHCKERRESQPALILVLKVTP